MVVLLAAIGVLFAFGGLVSMSAATAGPTLVGLACWFAINARLAQAALHRSADAKVTPPPT